MLSLVSILIGVGLHYVIPGSRQKVIFLITEFLAGGVL